MTQRVLKSPHEDLADAIEYIEELEDRIDREELEKALAEPSDPMPYEEFRKELDL